MLGEPARRGVNFYVQRDALLDRFSRYVDSGAKVLAFDYEQSGVTTFALQLRDRLQDQHFVAFVSFARGDDVLRRVMEATLLDSEELPARIDIDVFQKHLISRPPVLICDGLSNLTADALEALLIAVKTVDRPIVTSFIGFALFCSFKARALHCPTDKS
eukprot:m51a1_g13301 hypothetical protein (159) ;mRNA; r:818-1396